MLVERDVVNPDGEGTAEWASVVGGVQRGPVIYIACTAVLNFSSHMPNRS